MNRSFLLAVVILMLAAFAGATPISQEDAGTAAESRLVRDEMLSDRSMDLLSLITHIETGTVLAYVFILEPEGFVIAGADDRLPPVVAYSYTDGCVDETGNGNILLELVRFDLSRRMNLMDTAPESALDVYRDQWSIYLAGDLEESLPLLEQWPPAGSTPTGGWLMENWTQSPPYNSYVPLDLGAGQRSVAGCPAVTMGSILFFNEEMNGTRFDDGDDYYHNFYEQYWIDNDHVAHDFPSWPELNILLDTLQSHWDNSVTPTSGDKAALIFASGSACTQVYSASVSGTYGVGQAADAYQRFDFADSELLYASSDSLYERLSQNMISAMPAHLAIVDEGPNYGHNLVIDGYNTDDFYHFNFGWGGSYNGWYQFPLSGMPYSMNIIEGIILDIGEGQQGIEGSGTTIQPMELLIGSNPVSGDLVIDFTLLELTDISLSVYSITGHLVSTVVEGEFGQGTHGTCWNSSTAPQGVYIVRLSGPEGAVSRMVTVLR